MVKEFNLKEAEEHASNLERKLTFEGSIDHRFGMALRTFAKNEKDKLFKKAADRYYELVNVCDDKMFIKDSDKIFYRMCLGMDNLYKKGRVEMIHSAVQGLKKGVTTEMAVEYLKNIEIKYNSQDYSKEELYKVIDSLSDNLVLKYPNLVPEPKVRWNKKRDAMEFNFKTLGKTVSGHIVLGKKELTLYGNIPLEAIFYHNTIVNKIKGRLEKVLPKPIIQRAPTE